LKNGIVVCFDQAVMPFFISGTHISQKIKEKIM